jgi:carbamoyltransferase
LLLDARNIRLQARVNILKRRQWYRPVAPMILESDVPLLFDGMNQSGTLMFSSPYMSRAPAFTPSASDMFPAVTHFDGTARVQTVSAEDDLWIWELLRAVKALIGFGVLGNTSMNSRGAPILNTVAAGIELLREASEIDGLVIGSSAVELQVGHKTRDMHHMDSSVYIDDCSSENW